MRISSSKSDPFEFHPLNAFEKLVKEDKQIAEKNALSYKLKNPYRSEELSYQNLDAYANRLANYLLGLKLPLNSVIGLYFHSSIEFVISLFAVWKAGLAYIPLSADHPRIPEERLLDYMEGIEIPLIISHYQFKDKILFTYEKVRSKKHLFINYQTLTNEFNEYSECKPAIKLESTDLAYIICSSGTTGKPKQIQIEFKGIVPCVSSLARCFDFTRKDEMAIFSDIGFDASISEILTPLSYGATLHIVPHEIRDKSRKLGDYYRENIISVAIFTPSMVRVLNPTAFEKLRVLTLVGEAFEKELADKWRMGVPSGSKPRSIVNGYGPSEATIGTSVAIYNPEEPVHIGNPIDGLEMFVLEKGEPDKIPQVPKRVKCGVEGELYIAGTGLARGYMAEELTKERFPTIEHPDDSSRRLRVYRTFDLAQFDEKGLIQIVGRLDRQIKVYGRLICPEEIETAIQKYPGVQHVYVDPKKTKKKPPDFVEHPDFAAYVEIKDDSELKREDLNKFVDNLNKFIRKKLPPIMIPRRWRIESKPMSLTASGKVDGKKLLERKDDKFIYIQGPSSLSPDDVIGKKIAQIWHDILDIEESDCEFHFCDDFFLLGATSIQCMSLQNKLYNQFNVKVSMTDIRHSSTIEKLARHIRRLKKELPEHPELIPLCAEAKEISSPPLILIHSLLGDPERDYEKLKECWSYERPVYAIKARGLEHPEDMDSDLVMIANDYIRLIKSRWRSGPYLLGGWSAGGIIAFEMARILIEKGEKVALTMIDSESPILYHKKSDIEFADHLFKLFNEKLSSFGVGELKLEKSNLAKFTKEQQLNQFFDTLNESIKKAKIGTKEEKQKLGLISTVRNILSAIINYQFPTTAISGTLFVAADETQKRCGIKLGWLESVVKFEKLVTLKGDHDSIMVSRDDLVNGPRKVAEVLNDFYEKKAAEFVISQFDEKKDIKDGSTEIKAVIKDAEITRSTFINLDESTSSTVPMSKSKAIIKNTKVTDGSIIVNAALGKSKSSFAQASGIKVKGSTVINYTGAKSAGKRLIGSFVNPIGQNPITPIPRIAPSHPRVIEEPKSALRIASSESSKVVSVMSSPTSSPPPVALPLLLESSVSSTTTSALTLFGSKSSTSSSPVKEKEKKSMSIPSETTSTDSKATALMVGSEKFVKIETQFSDGLREKIIPYLKKLYPEKPKPKCFIAYAWGDEQNAKRLADYLAYGAECDVRFDKQGDYKGKKIAYFEKQLKEVDFILSVGTKKYLNQYNKWHSKEEEKQELKAYCVEDLNAQLIYQIERGHHDKRLPLLFDSDEESCFPHPDLFEQTFDFIQRTMDDSYGYFKELLRLIQDLYEIDDHKAKEKFEHLANQIIDEIMSPKNESNGTLINMDEEESSSLTP